MIRSTAIAVLATLASLPAQTSPTVSLGLFPFLEGNWDGQVATIVNDAVTRNIDTLYVSVFRATGNQTGSLWITDRAGWNPAWGSVRPSGAGIDLPPLIAAAHAQNINVVGVIRCFDEDVQPTDAGHKQYLLDIIDHLVHSYDPGGQPIYDLDGIALDYIRFVGSSGANSSLVTNFVGQIREQVGALTLHAYVLANRFSFDGPNYDLNFNSYTTTMSILQSSWGQDWAALSQYLDVLMPMCYTANGSIYNTFNEHQAYVQTAANYAGIAVSVGGSPDTLVVPVVKTYVGEGETTTSSTIDASISGAMLGGADGYQSFRYGTMRNNTSWFNAFSAYAEAGNNAPVARFGASIDGLTADIDPASSSDADQPSSQLDVRFDFDDDGTLDTAWMPLAVGQTLMPTQSGQRVSLRVRDADGNIAATSRRLIGGNALTCAPLYSASLGGDFPVQVDAGSAASGLLYLTLVSLSGTSPGFDWQGFHVPLNFDGMTNGFLTSVNTPVLVNGLGFLDAQGRATATFWLPPGILTPFVFETMTWCAIAADGTTNEGMLVTNPAGAVIVP